MKTRNFNSSLGLGTVLALALGLSSSVAGPGPQYWTQMEKIRAENKRPSVAAKPESRGAMICPACKTEAIRVFHPADLTGFMQKPARETREWSRMSAQVKLILLVQHWPTIRGPT